MTDITSTELRDLVYRLKYPPLKGAYQVKIDDVMKAIEAYVAQNTPDTRNISDWVDKGLASNNKDVWYRCLQLIKDELTNNRR